MYVRFWHRVTLAVNAVPRDVSKTLLSCPALTITLTIDLRQDEMLAYIADSVQVVVVSLDYRLAPEHPWPAASDDCTDTAVWLLENGSNKVRRLHCRYYALSLTSWPSLDAS